MRRKGGERKRIYIAAFIYYVYLKALRHGSHSFTCKYTMPALPFLRKRSPDGSTPNWGKRHPRPTSVVIEQSYIGPERLGRHVSWCIARSSCVWTVDGRSGRTRRRPSASEPDSEPTAAVPCDTAPLLPVALARRYAESNTRTPTLAISKEDRGQASRKRILRIFPISKKNRTFYVLSKWCIKKIGKVVSKSLVPLLQNEFTYCAQSQWLSVIV